MKFHIFPKPADELPALGVGDHHPPSRTQQEDQPGQGRRFVVDVGKHPVHKDDIQAGPVQIQVDHVRVESFHSGIFLGHPFQHFGRQITGQDTIGLIFQDQGDQRPHVQNHISRFYLRPGHDPAQAVLDRLLQGRLKDMDQPVENFLLKPVVLFAVGHVDDYRPDPDRPQAESFLPAAAIGPAGREQTQSCGRIGPDRPKRKDLAALRPFSRS